MRIYRAGVGSYSNSHAITESAAYNTEVLTIRLICGNIVHINYDRYGGNL